jgi:Periplasmic component of the Tol biopolymer transport system
MFRAALATTLLAALAVTICTGSARGAFPGNDGRIAFINDRNGTPSIFVMDPDGSNVQKLVVNNPQGGYAVASPDGKKILFSVRISTKLTVSYEFWTMDSDGNHVGRFIEDTSNRPFASTWSPNGKKIAYYRNGSLWVVNADRSDAREITNADFSGAAPSWSKRGLIAFDRGGSIWIVNPSKGKERRVGSGNQPSWSPDGRKLLFVAVPRSATVNDVFVMRADGSGRKRLTATPNVNEVQPTSSPGGRWIAFTAGKGVYAMRNDGKKLRLVAAKGVQPSWEKGTNGIVYTRRTARWSGFVLQTSLDGKHTRWLLRPRLDASPAWSPDGSELAFTRDGVVYLVDENGEVPRSTGLRGADPAWSPDGEHLVVASGLDLVIANNDGTSPTPLGLKFDPTSPTKYTSFSEPAWTVNAKNESSIAFSATDTDGIRSIFVVELQTRSLKPKIGPLEPLTLGCGSIGASSPTWAPDGSLIAFACDQSIVISGGDGSNPRPLGPAANATLAWSPDGSRIVFSKQFGSDLADLHVMNSDGTAPMTLNAGPGSSDQPDWQPLQPLP